jgi:cation diffusion facilitator CzcD-associated flavoprotein CzcO
MAGVDIPIHLYSLYFAPKTDWKRVFASQKEVMDYLEEVIESNSACRG